MRRRGKGSSSRSSVTQRRECEAGKKGVPDDAASPSQSAPTLDPRFLRPSFSPLLSLVFLPTIRVRLTNCSPEARLFFLACLASDLFSDDRMLPVIMRAVAVTVTPSVDQQT